MTKELKVYLNMLLFMMEMDLRKIVEKKNLISLKGKKQGWKYIFKGQYLLLDHAIITVGKAESSGV